MDERQELRYTIMKNILVNKLVDQKRRLIFETASLPDITVFYRALPRVTSRCQSMFV